MGHVVQYYKGTQIYEHSKTESHRKLIQRYADLTGINHVHCNDEYQSVLAESLPSKLLVLCDEDEVDEVTDQLNKAIGDEANIVRGSPPFFVEILHKEVCKGRGVERMCEAMGVKLEEVVAFGDGDNDIEFIQVAGCGIAMKNARITVKDVADEVCEWSNAEDGVILKLQQMEKDQLLRYY
mmetsp:Transcript_46126/g.55541  ORF Transcript_46126/g.55541 Transcript_46126/m.55541 type:complete len:181 (-) Transcript_46126:121-663(-)